MFRKVAFLVSSALLCAGGVVPASAQVYSPYEQCMIDYCIGQYIGNPVGYQACRQWCLREFGPPQVVPAPDDGKLD